MTTAPTMHHEPAREYVLGFMFNDTRSNVLLIRKTKPNWQAGLLNGVGGKIESGERPLHAMIREFIEETDVHTYADQWSFFAKHSRPAYFENDPDSYNLYVFSGHLAAEQIAQVKQTTEEEPVWIGVEQLAELMLDTGVPGCAMYVAMALNHMGRSFFTTTDET